MFYLSYSLYFIWYVIFLFYFILVHVIFLAHFLCWTQDPFGPNINPLCRPSTAHFVGRFQAQLAPNRPGGHPFFLFLPTRKHSMPAVPVTSPQLHTKPAACLLPQRPAPFNLSLAQVQRPAGPFFCKQAHGSFPLAVLFSYCTRSLLICKANDPMHSSHHQGPNRGLAWPSTFRAQIWSALISVSSFSSYLYASRPRCQYSCMPTWSATHVYSLQLQLSPPSFCPIDVAPTFSQRDTQQLFPMRMAKSQQPPLERSSHRARNQATTRFDLHLAHALLQLASCLPRASIKRHSSSQLQPPLVSHVSAFLHAT